MIYFTYAAFRDVVCGVLALNIFDEYDILNSV